MKRLIILLFAILISVLSFAQQKMTRVTLKSGTIVTGTIVEFNPSSHITLNVSGFETRIEMADVESVEAAPGEAAPSLGNDASIVSVESSNYPPVHIVEIGPYELELILVKGGQFSMGFDGRGSQKLRSEPVHEVILNDYYVNRYPLGKDLVTYLKSGKGDPDENYRSYSAKGWRDANKIAESLATVTGLPFQLISESQWEYMATTDAKSLLEVERNESNYCLDLFGEYIETARPIVDPTGPTRGSSHVVRFLDAAGPQVFGRESENKSLVSNVIRISVLASALFNN